MSSRKFIIAAGTTGLMFSGFAFGVSSQFENHLKSNNNVSPAQEYHTDGVRSDFQLSLINSDFAITNDDADSNLEAEASMTEVFAAGIYQMDTIRAGFSLSHLTGDISYTNESDSSTTDGKSESTYTTMTPFASIEIGNIVAGAAFDFTSEETIAEDQPTESASYSTFHPGVVYKDAAFEAGITYHSPHNFTEEFEEDGTTTTSTYSSPAMTIVHGAYAVDKNITVGAAVHNNAYKALDEDSSTDQSELDLYGSMVMNNLKVGGNFNYMSSYYKEKENMDLGNISTMKFGAEADYSVEKEITVGGGIEYQTGSDENDTSKYDVSGIRVAFRGNYIF
jgi:hypothetical protein